MPHLQIQYSPGLETLVNLQDLCDQLNDVMVATGVFPLAGVRVRAFRADVVSIADKHPSNAFCAMQVYMGAGRTLIKNRLPVRRLTIAPLRFSGLYSANLILC